MMVVVVDWMDSDWNSEVFDVVLVLARGGEGNPGKRGKTPSEKLEASDSNMALFSQ